MSAQKAISVSQIDSAYVCVVSQVFDVILKKLLIEEIYINLWSLNCPQARILPP